MKILMKKIKDKEKIKEIKDEDLKRRKKMKEKVEDEKIMEEDEKIRQKMKR